MDKIEFSNHLKSMRAKARLTQAALANLIGSYAPSIAKYEQGKALPRNLDQFLNRLDEIVENINITESPRKKFSKKITMGEELEWEWYEEDILEAQAMYEKGISLVMIASSFGRPNLETSIMLAIRVEEGHIEPRTSGVFGRLEG